MINLKEIKGDSFVQDYNKFYELEELKNSLSIFTSKSKFQDDKWLLDKLTSEKVISIGQRTLYFSNINEKYINLIKYYSIIRLINRISIGTIQNYIIGIKHFLKFLDKNFPEYELKSLNKKIIYSYKEYLDALNISATTKESRWTSISSFFNVMSSWDNMPTKQIINFYENPYSKLRKKKSIETKYIDKYITDQLDIVFRDERIPIPYRTIYWISRLIPSRISEICSMKLDCIKPYINEKIIIIPMFKQNGGYKQGETRQIAITETEEMGKYLLNLIRQQIEYCNSLKHLIKIEKNKDYLFSSYMYCNYKSNNKEFVKKYLDKTFMISPNNWVNIFNRICKNYNVKDKHGSIVLISSHQFRHNAITDRIYEGFRLIDIMSMTNHKNEKMIINSYLHINEEELEKKQRQVIKEDSNEVYFKGRIINSSNPRKYDQILKRPFAHKIGRMGICSDISNCKSKMFECLTCESFIPNAEELEYFEEQVKQWQDKVNKFKSNQYLYENALYNLELNQKIIIKIKNAII